MRVRACVGCVLPPLPPAVCVRNGPLPGPCAYRPPPAAVCRAYQPPDPRRLVPLGRRLNRTGPGNPATFDGDASSMMVRASSSCGSSMRQLRFPARRCGVLHHRPGPGRVRHHRPASSSRRKPCHVRRRRVLDDGACLEQLRVLDASAAVSWLAWVVRIEGWAEQHALKIFVFFALIHHPRGFGLCVPV